MWQRVRREAVRVLILAVGSTVVGFWTLPEVVGAARPAGGPACCIRVIFDLQPHKDAANASARAKRPLFAYRVLRQRRLAQGRWECVRPRIPRSEAVIAVAPGGRLLSGRHYPRDEILSCRRITRHRGSAANIALATRSSTMAPSIVAVQTDAAGNVIAYVEQMTRTLGAGPWTPIGSGRWTCHEPDNGQYPAQTLVLARQVTIVNSPPRLIDTVQLCERQ